MSVILYYFLLHMKLFTDSFSDWMIGWCMWWYTSVGSFERHRILCQILFSWPFLIIKIFWFLTVQARLLRGSSFAHETLGHYKTVEELWDGELWSDNLVNICSDGLRFLIGRGVWVSVPLISATFTWLVLWTV